ncbi:MAG: 3-phosphoshikimate 1-carboxyvinyltransferase [Candidatus Bipolaricaulota bacterium]|nr:3-phosphoshikimate 1-carboxyvinyltransferase [Candidatus Bipolaricaulota bacterium]
MRRVIKPGRSVKGVLRVPGDKSISHRALLCGSLADGPVRIENLSPAHDVRNTALSLQALGVVIRPTLLLPALSPNPLGKGVGVRSGEARGEVFVHNAEGFSPPARVLDAGNSGTTMRLLAGLLAGQNFAATITGDASLRKRPMQRVIDPLTQMGAKIESDNGYAPLKIIGQKLRGIRYELPIASSQVKSALLLAGLHAKGVTTVSEPSPTRDHSERMLRYLGISLEISNGAVSVQGGARPKAKALMVPGDFSSAAFFLVVGALVPDAQITITDVGINPTRTGLLDVLRAMGAQIAIENEREIAHEPWGDLTVKSSELRAVRVGGALIPRMIDELPVLAICATQAHGTTVIQDAHELRVKETDRIRAVTENLKRMGAQLEERADGWVIAGPQKLHGAVLDSFGDHRIAMAFAIAGLIAQGETIIEGAEWVEISYPEFFEDLESLVRS